MCGVSYGVYVLGCVLLFCVSTAQCSCGDGWAWEVRAASECTPTYARVSNLE